MIVPFGHVIFLAGLLFLLGILCAVCRRNLIMILLGVEIMLNAGSIVFVGAALRWFDLEGQAFILMILAIAATEVAIGLAMIVYAFRRTESLDPSVFNSLSEPAHVSGKSVFIRE